MKTNKSFVIMCLGLYNRVWHWVCILFECIHSTLNSIDLGAKSLYSTMDVHMYCKFRELQATYIHSLMWAMVIVVILWISHQVFLFVPCHSHWNVVFFHMPCECGGPKIYLTRSALGSIIIVIWLWFVISGLMNYVKWISLWLHVL